MLLLAWRSFSRDKKMIRNTVLICISFIVFFAIRYVDRFLLEHYKETSNPLVMFLTEAVSSFSRLSIGIVVSICLLIVALEIRYDSNEYYILDSVGFTKSQMFLYGIYKYMIQFLIAVFLSVLLCYMILKK